MFSDLWNIYPVLQKVFSFFHCESNVWKLWCSLQSRIKVISQVGFTYFSPVMFFIFSFSIKPVEELYDAVFFSNQTEIFQQFSSTLTLVVNVPKSSECVHVTQHFPCFLLAQVDWILTFVIIKVDTLFILVQLAKGIVLHA